MDRRLRRTPCSPDKGRRWAFWSRGGFADSLSFRRGIRDHVWDHRAPNPPVLAKRHLRLPVGGRIDRDGAEFAPLEEADVRAAAEEFAREGVEAAAVCFFSIPT